MAGVNKVILVGNLGSDPEVRYLDGGSVVARFNIATSESYTNRNGERVEQTEWHKIELWDNLAKIAEQYLRKGNQVYIEGKLKTETWQDKDGAQRTGVRVRATSMQLLGGRSNSGESQDSGETHTEQAPVAAPAPARQQAAAPRQAAAPATAAAAPAAQSRPAAQATRRQPEPTPFESGGDDDLPF
ncbi:hypothetical protein GCM10023189_31150 [Nibrella saemangeumensis]|uniref:Single-stranded DNA-binding protein n=1 Tax=Nibrella saemangeumensis TaxID=1084526 RepID=A0ABP8N393_9BACT